MECVFLDKGSLDRGDINFDHLKSKFSRWIEYETTAADETLSRINNADVIITNKVKITETILRSCNKLKLVCVAATGTNNVDLAAAKKLNIPVCNVTGYATHSVVQHVFSLILALHNNLINYDQLVKSHAWDKSDHFCLLNYPITEMYGKTLGIIGYGELGKAVANVAGAFGINVIIAESLTGRQSNNRLPLDHLLQQSDIISLHCPLTPQTQNLINQQALELMKPSSFLINAARGGIVNEQDLLQALKQKRIAGAALDVLSEEPPHNNILIDANLPNLIITPHIAWASQRSRQNLVEELEKNIEAFFNREERNLV